MKSVIVEALLYVRRQHWNDQDHRAPRAWYVIISRRWNPGEPTRVGKDNEVLVQEQKLKTTQTPMLVVRYSHSSEEVG